MYNKQLLLTTKIVTDRLRLSFVGNVKSKETIFMMKKTCIHINDICVGDTVEHNGQILTVNSSSIKENGFMGRTLFGDSYLLGHQLVVKIEYQIDNQV